MKNQYFRLVQSLTLACIMSVGLLACSKHDDGPAKVDDATLATNVKAALAADPSLQGMQIDVQAKDGVVELTGQFDSYQRLDKVLAITGNTPGVVHIDDKTTKREGPAEPVAAEPVAPAAEAPAAPAAEAAPATPAK